MKKKLLAWCDFVAPTGFANVAKNLFENLHRNFDVSIVGINYFGDKKYDTSKYFVYSVIPNIDPLGISRLKDIVAAERPDIIFLFQDSFYIANIIDQLKSLSPTSKIVTYFPVDGGPFSIAWKKVLYSADAVITYSDYGIKTIKDVFPEFSKPIHKIYHGVDINTFYVLPYNDILEKRNKNKIFDKFFVININRFQPRKAIPLTIRTFSMFAKGYKYCTKCNHYYPINLPRCDLNMCDAKYSQVFDEPKSDVFLYLHMMPIEKMMGASRTCSLWSHMYNNGFVDEDYGKLIAVNNKSIYEKNSVSEKDLNDIYNMANVNVSTSIGEGAGLSLLESAATGTPSIAPLNSAIPEQLNNTGILVENNAVYGHPYDNGFIRPHVDPWKFKLALDQVYSEWKKIKNQTGLVKHINIDCILNIYNNFLWEDKRNYLEKIFYSVLAN